VRPAESRELARTLREAVKDGVIDALSELKIVEEIEHPITGKYVGTHTLGTFVTSSKKMRAAVKTVGILALATCALGFGACASQVTPTPVFQAPSLAPVEQAVTRVEQHVSGARDAARKLADATDAVTKTNKAWQDAYDQLNAELNNAYLEIQTTKDELKVKQAEVTSLTDSANKAISQVAQERDVQKAKADAEYKAKMAWMKRCFIAGGALLLSVAWITKGIWIPMIAGMGI